MSLRAICMHVVVCDWPECGIDTETLGGAPAPEKALALDHWHSRGGIRVHPDPAKAPGHFCPAHALDVCHTCGVSAQDDPELLLVLDEEDGWHYCTDHIAAVTG